MVVRGWARNDRSGQYSFKTIRPQAYPGRDIPQHIHMHVIEPNLGTYYIDDVTFKDDPLLTTEHRRETGCRGGCGEVTPKRNKQGIWQVKRDIYLGLSIND